MPDARALLPLVMSPVPPRESEDAFDARNRTRRDGAVRVLLHVLEVGRLASPKRVLPASGQVAPEPERQARHGGRGSLRLSSR